MSETEKQSQQSAPSSSAADGVPTTGLGETYAETDPGELRNRGQSGEAGGATSAAITQDIADLERQDAEAVATSPEPSPSLPAPQVNGAGVVTNPQTSGQSS